MLKKSTLSEAQIDYLIAWANKKFPHNSYEQNARIAQSIIEKRRKNKEAANSQSVNFPPEGNEYPELKSYYDCMIKYAKEQEFRRRLGVKSQTGETHQWKQSESRMKTIMDTLASLRDVSKYKCTEIAKKNGFDINVTRINVFSREIKGIGFMMCIDTKKNKFVIIRKDGLIMDKHMYDYADTVISEKWNKFISQYNTTDISYAW